MTGVGIKGRKRLGQTLNGLLDSQQDEQVRKSFVCHEILITQAPVEAFLGLYGDVLERLAFEYA